MNIIQWDIALFEWVNDDLSSPLLDFVLPWMREPLFWLPLYLFIISFVFFNFRWKAYWFVLFLLLTVGSADMVSSRIIKKTVKRLRPCNTEHIHVIERVHCGSGYSFTSSHATNHFAIATFLIMILGGLFRWIKPWLWTWAAIISFSQVYVGVHFPIDIVCGATIGIIIGWGWAILFNRYYGLLSCKNKITA